MSQRILREKDTDSSIPESKNPIQTTGTCLSSRDQCFVNTQCIRPTRAGGRKLYWSLILLMQERNIHIRQTELQTTSIRVGIYGWINSQTLVTQFSDLTTLPDTQMFSKYWLKAWINKFVLFNSFCILGSLLHVDSPYLSDSPSVM